MLSCFYKECLGKKRLLAKLWMVFDVSGRLVAFSWKVEIASGCSEETGELC